MHTYTGQRVSNGKRIKSLWWNDAIGKPFCEECSVDWVLASGPLPGVNHIVQKYRASIFGYMTPKFNCNIPTIGLLGIVLMHIRKKENLFKEGQEHGLTRSKIQGHLSSCCGY